MPQCALPTKSLDRWPNAVLMGAVFAFIAAALASWLWFDQGIISRLARTRGDWGVSPAVDVFSRLGKVWLQVWLLLIWFAMSRRRRDVHAGLLALVIAGAAVIPVKYAVARPRPYVLLRAQEYGAVDTNATHHLSFPSGDTAATVAVAAAILPALGWPLRLMLAGVCGAIGALRVGVAAHYPSDVLAGVAMGLLAGWLAIRLMAAWGRSDRPVPLETWLVLLGIAGIPIAVGIADGVAELTPVLKTYSAMILCVVLAAAIRNAVRKALLRRLVAGGPDRGETA